MEELRIDILSALPEDLVSEILSRTSPPDVCRLSAISKGFKYVADSDNVWDRFLPSGHRELISRSVVYPPVAFSTKKQLYFRLANSFILLDGGKLSFSLDKASGKKCFMLAARELAIEGDRSSVDHSAWRYSRQSRFSEVAYLQELTRFDITGKIEARLLSPKTTYVAYLVFRLGPRNYGCNFLPVEASVRFDGERGDRDGDKITNIVSLAIRSFHSFGFFRPFRSDEQFAKQRMDKWMETELGEFFNSQGDTGEVEIRLIGFEGDYRKYDIVVQGIELRPKVNS